MQLRHPRPPSSHPPHSLCHSTLKTCTKTPLLPAGMSSSLAVQFLNQNYQLLPPQVHHLLLGTIVGNWVMVLALRECLSLNPSATGAGISSFPHQVSRPDWLHRECHLVNSRCITSPAIITVPWALTGDGTTSSCLFLKSAGSKPVHPGAEGAVHARLSCKAHGFGATQAHSQLLQAASSGFLFKGGSAPLPQSHCGSAGTCANPLPGMSHQSLS